MHTLPRRKVMKLLAGSSLAVGLWPLASRASATEGELLQKPIPSSGQPLTVIGMGTWQTFNVGKDPALLDERAEVLKAFFEGGGQLLDSSPMYGSSQAALGHGLEKLGYPEALFSADKVWTRDGDATREQVAASAGHWGVETFDLMQVHNLLSVEAHLETLQTMKAEGKLRYVGLTTSHGRRHRELEDLMSRHPIDFVQLTYNIRDRDAEARLLPLAREKGIAVIANRPFQGGPLVKKLQERELSLPDWAAEIDCGNWPQFLLKFIVSHPAISCAIPATTQVAHAKENMGAARGRLPDAALRKRMLNHFQGL